MLETFNLDLLSRDDRSEIEALNNSALTVISESQKLKDIGLNDLTKLDSKALNVWRDALQLFKQRVSALFISLARTINKIEEENAYAKQQEIDLRHGGKPMSAR